MTRPNRTTATTVVAALLTGLAGLLAFNAVDGVFGFVQALLGLAASIAITLFVVRRSPPPEEEPDA